LSELADPFDSVYISFYKGLGSISGAMLMGEKDFCDEARVWLRRFGGNLYTLLPYAASSWAGYRRHVSGHGSTMSFTDKLNKLLRITERIEAKTVFSKIGTFNPLVPETNMVHVYLKKPLDSCKVARDAVYQKLGLKVFSRIKEIPSCDPQYSAGYRAYFEWTMGEANGSVDDESFVQAWKQFSSDLLQR
jgi:threonine aldolase